MDLEKLGKKAGINFPALFSQNSADLHFVLQQLEDVPHKLAAILLCDIAKEYQASAQKKVAKLLQGFKVKLDNLKADLKWANLQLERLPDDVAASLQNEYFRKHKAKNNRRSANIWLRKRVEALHNLVKQFPLPIWHINSEVRRAQIAHEWANRCASILHNMTEFGNKQVDALELLTAVKEPADQWGFCPSLPSFKHYQLNKNLGVYEQDPTMYDLICGAIARLIDESWWARKLEKSFKQYKEHCAIVTGKVRAGVSPYVSNKTLLDYQSRKKANAAWLNTMIAVNEEHGFELSLADAVAASVSNPEVRRSELMVRMRGFEEMAQEQGYIGEFYTWTAPSKYHSWKKAKKGKPYSNKKYEGASPRHTQQYLCKQWAKARAKLAREEIELFGFRVVEPHHDGTPHWHLLLFFRPDQLRQARSIMRRYALQHDKHDLAPAKGKKSMNHQGYRPRFDFKTIDPEKGSATGYIAKYIAKNIDGAYVADDFEAESSGKHGAEGVAAWASTWNIRQFQQIGGPSVTVWRELRRLREAVTNDEILERARKAADAANWQSFIENMGGVKCPRADRPVQLAKVVNQAASKYGEDVQKVMGVVATATAQTRIEGWEIRSPKTETANSTDELQFEDAASSLSHGSGAPWSSDNNCTETIKNNKKISKSDRQLILECQKLGLDEFLTSRLRAGAVIKNVVNGSEQYIRLRDGMLLVSRHAPDDRNDFEDSAFNTPIEAMNKAIENRLNKALRQQAWEVFTQGKDIEQWVADMEPAIAKQALKQLSEVIELHRSEKYAQPGWNEKAKEQDKAKKEKYANYEPF